MCCHGNQTHNLLVAMVKVTHSLHCDSQLRHTLCIAVETSRIAMATPSQSSHCLFISVWQEGQDCSIEISRIVSVCPWVCMCVGMCSQGTLLCAMPTLHSGYPNTHSGVQWKPSLVKCETNSYADCCHTTLGRVSGICVWFGECFDVPEAATFTINHSVLCLVHSLSSV